MMSVLEESSRRASFAVHQRKVTDPGVTFDYNRKASLKEMPSFRDEASRALNRIDDLARIKERLSASKELLTADPATKPWLRKASGVEGLTTPSSRQQRAPPSGVTSSILEDSFDGDIHVPNSSYFETSASSSMSGPEHLDPDARYRPRNLSRYSAAASSETFYSESATGYYDLR